MLINIITICFNNLSGLTKTYNSIINQTYIKFNWIVIDGGSTDGSIDFLERVKDINRIELSFKSEKDKGIYDAMNKGIEQSKGDYLLFLNAGDELADDNILKKIFNDLENQPSIIYGNYYRELKDGTLLGIKAKPLQYIYHSLPTSHQAIFYNRKAINNLRYDLKYKISSDYFFTSKLVKDLNCIEEKDYLIINDEISIFEYNGLSRNNLSLLYKDAFYIQKEIFNLNIFFRTFSYLFKYLRNKLL